MLGQSMQFLAVGIEIGVSVVIGIVAGSAGDTYFGTTPWLFWLGLTLGFGAAVKAVVDATRKAKKVMEENGNEISKED